MGPCRGALRSRQLDVQFDEAPQDVGRDVAVAAGAGWTVLLLVDVDLAVRSNRRSRLTRASARASGAPGQVWMPRPKEMCVRASARSGLKVWGSSILPRDHGWPPR